MKFLQTIVLILFFCSIGKIVFAQDFKKDIKRVQEVYKVMDKYHGEVITTTFNDQGEKPMDTKKMVIKKAGKSFLYEMDGVKMLFNEKYSVTTNPKSQLIAFQKNPKVTQDQLNLIPDIDELLANFSEVEYKGVIKGDKVYLVKNIGSMISEIEIFIDKKTFLFSKMVYYYNDQIGYEYTKSVIQMRHLNTNPTFSKNLFSERKYVTIKEGQVKLNPKYKKFELILGQGLAYWQNE